MNKIGILTFVRSYNYGTFLQAYASLKLLQNYFCNDCVEIVDFDYRNRTFLKRINLLKPSCDKYYLSKLRTYIINKNCLKKNLTRSKRIITSSLEDGDKKIINLNYNFLISGSDEIWANKKDMPFPNSFFISDNINCKKASMATSANRGDYSKLNKEEKTVIFKRLKKYDYITVRDVNTRSLLKSIGIDSKKILLDPTLAYDFPKCKYSTTLKKKLKKYKGKKILIMLSNKKLAKFIIEKYNKEYKLFSIYNHYKSTIPLVINQFEFTSIFGDFDFVITDFFHGTIFSIKNKTNFISIDSEQNYLSVESKIEYLLKKFNLLNRYYKITNINDQKEKDSILNKINFLMSDNPEYNIEKRINIIKKDYNHFFKTIEGVLNEKNT